MIRVETGITTKNLFLLVVVYTKKFKGKILCFYNWKVKAIKLED